MNIATKLAFLFLGSITISPAAFSNDDDDYENSDFEDCPSDGETHVLDNADHDNVEIYDGRLYRDSLGESGESLLVYKMVRDESGRIVCRLSRQQKKALKKGGERARKHVKAIQQRADHIITIIKAKSCEDGDADIISDDPDSNCACSSTGNLEREKNKSRSIRRSASH